MGETLQLERDGREALLRGRRDMSERHPVDQVPPVGRLSALGLQHVLAMYAGAVAVPLILGQALKLPQGDVIYVINADLFTCGIATLITTIGFWKIGFKLPVIQGAAFAVLTPMILVGQRDGLRAVYGAIIVAGVIVFLLSPYFSRLLRFFPPVVRGSIVTVIGISLLPVAVQWAAGNPAKGAPADPESVALAIGVLALIIALYRLFSGFIGRIAVLLGAAIGTVVAALLGLTDFSGVSDAHLLGVTTPFHFGAPVFSLSAIAAMTLAMLVVMMETTGNSLAVGEIVDRPVDSGRLARGLRADGLSTALGGILNAFPYTAYAQNAGLVRLTGVRSRYVVAAAGVFLIVLGLVPKLAAVVASIPAPVLGGAGLAMFGAVAAVGIRTLTQVDFERNGNLIIVAVALALAVIPVASPNFYAKFPHGAQTVLNSGITAGSVAAVLLNLVFNVFSRVPPASREPALPRTRRSWPVDVPGS
jgi:uric acid transporter